LSDLLAAAKLIDNSLLYKLIK